MANIGRMDRGDGMELASEKLDGRGPTVVFLPGFRSDMTGDKATALAAFCARARQRHAAVRLFRARIKRRPVRGRHDRRLDRKTP